jgi:hypothetical protein
MKTPKPFGDVPIKLAMIAWTPMSSRIGIPGRIVVIPHLNDDKDWFRHLGLTDSTGACCHYWSKATKQQRILQIYIEAWHIVCRDWLDPKDVHEALTVIPEYRETLSGDSFFADFRKSQTIV